MIAVAIYGLKNGQPLTEEEKMQHNEIKFSGKTEKITQEQLNLFKAEISGAMRFIKAYTGPSKTWFAIKEIDKMLTNFYSTNDKNLLR